MRSPWLATCALLALLVTGPARAEDPSDDRATAFQAVEGAVQEDVPGGPLLVAAYALVWLGVFGYLVRLVRLQRHSEHEVARLERILGRPDDPPAASPPG